MEEQHYISLTLVPMSWYRGQSWCSCPCVPSSTPPPSHHPMRTQWFGIRWVCWESTKDEEAVAQRQRQGWKTNQEWVLQVCLESQFLPSSLLVHGGPGGRRERTGMFGAPEKPHPSTGTRRVAMLTYRWAHWSRQPRFPLWMCQTGKRHQHQDGSTTSSTVLQHGTLTFCPFTLAATMVPSGLMMTPGSPFSPCKRHTNGAHTQCHRAGTSQKNKRPEAVTFIPGAPWMPGDPGSPFGPTGPYAEEQSPHQLPSWYPGAAPLLAPQHSPGNQRVLICPAGGAHSEQRGGCPQALPRYGWGSYVLWGGTYLWARQSHQRPLEKQTKCFLFNGIFALEASLQHRQSCRRGPLLFPCDRDWTGPFPPSFSSPQHGNSTVLGH